MKDKDKAKINYAFLKQRKMRNNGFLGVARWYSIYFVSFFLKFLQINNNIPYLMAVQKRFIFTLKFFCASLLKIMHFELPPAYKIEHMKTKLVAVTICHFAKYPTWKRFSIRDIFFIHPV